MSVVQFTARASFPFEETTIADIHAALRDGTATVASLVEGYLRRIEAYDRNGPKINSIVNVNQCALAQADALDKAFAETGELAGPLHGVPVLVKDCIETDDVDTTFGNIAFAGNQATTDATVVRKLRAAGAVILAKTTLPDFATSWWAYSSMSGETRNPYALDRDPGASSAGSGAATAANLGAVSLGTDCGGSIRVPASFNNLVGVRSTPGLISRNGVACLVFLQDTIGPMTRTVTDAALVFDALVGYDPDDPLTVAYDIARAPQTYTDSLSSTGLAGAKIGLVVNALGSDDDPHAAPVNQVIREAVTTLRGAGAEVVEVEIPDLAHHLAATSLYVNRTKFDINNFLSSRPNAPVRTLQQIYESQQYHPMLDLLEACAAGPERPEYDPQYYGRLAAREEFTRAVLNLMAAHGLDALTYPSIQVAPPTRAEIDARTWTTLTFPTNTLIASQAWLPAITVPANFTADDLPVGLEIVGRPYDEPRLFSLAYGFEQAGNHRRPPACAPELS